MFVEIVLLIPVLFLLTAYIRQAWRRPKNLPPGPPALPIIGNLAQMRDNAPEKISEWHKIYGDTITVYMGERPMIVMHDFHTVKKVFGDDITTGRDQNFAVDFFQNRGLVISQGELWKEHRRFAISTLRDMGMGKTWLEDDIIAESEDMCKILKATNGSPVNPKTLMSHSVSNVICSLVFGKRFSHSDEKFTRLTSLLAENIQIVGRDGAVLSVFPFLKFIPGSFHKRFQRIMNNFRDLGEFTTALIKQHRSDLSAENDGGKDYIDSYLQEAKRQKGTKSTFDDLQLLASVLNLFAAGTETTSTTLLWSFILMVEHPDVMQKVQDEIGSHVGSDPVVRMDHRTKLPYTEATILEVQRFANLVPLGVLHQTLGPTEIDGYTVPKGAFLAANLASIHMDPRYWDHPEVFDPGHFLDDEGKLKKPDGFAPFSVGKRACLGESLAKMELYLFFSNILRNFELKNVRGKQVSHLNAITGLVSSPKPYEILFVARG